ncbi:tRNA modification GTPase MnmE [Rubripirellula obstinata]|uniref:tRNA modification GTPase MnmE n=1 Tax=Rubripirellula obstinata TaxID=406547 RepID=A0A5B1CDV1_9BACT|nr:GTPase domain-containing protein [Rubripirellula obstinata]KAA1259298.1 tRNA modification GTPase MnmE [Rubripirellula obstinata]
MIDRRLFFVSFLVALPVLVCVCFGAHAIWVTGYWKSLWWVLPGCWVLAWLASQFWKPGKRVSDAADAIAIDPKVSKHWSARDHEAAKIIDRHQRDIETIDAAKLSDPHHYLSQAQVLAAELAEFYHGKSKRESASQVIDSLTVVEVAAAARLAIDDLEEWILESVPGSSLVTIRQWRAITSTPKWYSQVSKVYWAASTLVNPANLIRYATSRATLDPVVGQLQSEVVATIYLNFLRRVGFYLIEMNSGRLRGGAIAYSTAFGNESHSPQLKDVPVSIALVGQTSAGKSSLINALVGDQVATTDLLPETRQVSRYQYQIDGEDQASSSLTLLDTPGYGEAGASKQQLADSQQAAANADVVLLVIDGHSSARAADQSMIQELDAHFAAQPKLRRPPVICVMTHIDLIPPASVWDPPYDFESPADAKEDNIRGARDYAEEVFGDSVVGVACVCLADRTSGISEWGVAEHLLPLLIQNLDDGRAVSIVRIFENEVDSNRFKKVMKQAKRFAGDAFQTWFDQRLGS